MSDDDTWRLFAAQWYGISKVAECISESERLCGGLEETLNAQYDEFVEQLEAQYTELEQRLDAQYAELDGKSSWVHHKPEAAKA